MMFTQSSSKNAQIYCQPSKDSICYNQPHQTHDEDHFHYPQILGIAPGIHTGWFFNRAKNHKENYQKIAKKLKQRQNIQPQLNSCFTPALNLKLKTFASFPSFIIQREIPKKL